MPVESAPLEERRVRAERQRVEAGIAGEAAVQVRRELVACEIALIRAQQPLGSNGTYRNGRKGVAQDAGWEGANLGAEGWGCRIGIFTMHAQRMSRITRLRGGTWEPVSALAARRRVGASAERAGRLLSAHDHAAAGLGHRSRSGPGACYNAAAREGALRAVEGGHVARSSTVVSTGEDSDPVFHCLPHYRADGDFG